MMFDIHYPEQSWTAAIISVASNYIRTLQKDRFIDITKNKEKNISVIKHTIIFLLAPLGGRGFIIERG